MSLGVRHAFPPPLGDEPQGTSAWEANWIPVLKIPRVEIMECANFVGTDALAVVII